MDEDPQYEEWRDVVFVQEEADWTHYELLKPAKIFFTFFPEHEKFASKD